MIAGVLAVASVCVLIVPAVPLGLALAVSISGVAAAFVARWSGRRQLEPFDGRLSLLAALVCGVVTLMLARAVPITLQSFFAS